MAHTIIERLNDLSDFPAAVDTFIDRRDGQGREHVINAEIVNKIEASLYRTQEYAQKAVRVWETTSVTGDRKRLKVTTSLSVNAGSGKDYVEYNLQLTAEQLRFLGNNPLRPGNIIMVSVTRRDGSGDGYRGTATPLSNDTFRIFIDRIDASGKVQTGTYHLDLTIIGG